MRQAKKVFVIEYLSTDGSWLTSIDAPVFRLRKAAVHWRNATETRRSMQYRISRFDRAQPKKPTFYRIYVSGKCVESFDYLHNARAFAKQVASEGEYVKIVAIQEGRTVSFKAGK